MVAAPYHAYHLGELRKLQGKRSEDLANGRMDGKSADMITRFGFGNHIISSYENDNPFIVDSDELILIFNPTN